MNNATVILIKNATVVLINITTVVLKQHYCCIRTKCLSFEFHFKNILTSPERLVIFYKLIELVVLVVDILVNFILATKTTLLCNKTLMTDNVMRPVPYKDL